MINNIGEGALRTAMKIEPGGAIHDKQVAQEKAEEVRQARPVEDAASGGKSESKKTRDEGTSKYLLDHNTVVYEKYDKNGDLIFRVPPSYKPVDERA
ncbi:MAG: hypothetical protein HKP58_04930 [Desulfatitalea sp.]|nr:hypothetical protein [Desulfatitalea sp.]NNJ99737.1 hypothetical protein [Desulfatitalea sp.]